MTSPENSRSLSVRFRGVRGSIPSPSTNNIRYGANTSCVEVRYGHQLLILDAGSGIRSLGEDLLASADEQPVVATLLLSHAHWDHIQGLPFFSPGYRDTNDISIFAGPARAGYLQRALENQMGPPHFPVPLQHMRALRPVKELGPAETKIGTFVVRTIELNHPGGCTGFRIETGGSSLAYFADHEPYRPNDKNPDAGPSAQQALIEFVRNVDLLILDTQYTADEYAGRIGWGHGCLLDSVRLATACGAGRLILFHHDPAHNDHKIDQMVETALTLSAGAALTVEAAAENKTLKVGHAAGHGSGPTFSSTSHLSVGDAVMPHGPPGFREPPIRLRALSVL